MRARAILTLGVIAATGLSTPTPAAAQSSLPQLETIEVTEPLHATLVLLQEQWLDWLTAYHRRDAEEASEVLAEIVVTMSELRVERLSDLAFGAMVSAVQAARASDFERAEWALDTAELLDSRRPEISFAAATIARLEGKRLAAIGHQVKGYYRLMWFPWERTILAQDLLLWALFILILSAALFVVLLASAKGGRFYGDLVDLMSRRLPERPAKVAALVVLVFPLVLPNGLLWLLVFWTIALWGYGSRSERVVVAGIWLLLGIVPEVVSEQRRQMTITMSAPVRAIQNLALSRLEGSMLTDLGDLRLLLPESIAVKHLMADVHQQLGQWEFARALYLDVVDAEPGNGEAILNLGAFYFRVGDYASAIQLFQRASVKDSVAAAANFNLSQAYSASYMFVQSGEALRTARQFDEDGVSRWVGRAEEERVVTLDGGIQRLDGIDAELRAALNPSEPEVSFVRRLLKSGSMRLALLVAVLALIVHFCARRSSFYRFRQEEALQRAREKGQEALSMTEILLPGVAAARRERGYDAFVSMFLPVTLLTLPLVRSLGYRIPWGYEPGDFLVWTIAIVGLLAYISRRLYRGLKA